MIKYEPRLIVSLTSYGERLETLDICIKSLIKQTKTSDKIVVYLTNDIQEKDLPDKLLTLKKDGLEFRFIPLDLKPHKKYYYAMQEFPDDLIVTVDDDVIYDPELLEKLYQTYQKFPNCVVTGRAHEITFDEQGNFKPYNDWKWESAVEDKPSMKFIATGAGGILYPPHLIDSNILLDLAEIKRYLTVDDLWLKTAEVLSGVSTVICDCRMEERRQGIPNTQEQGLFNNNIGQNENDLHLKDLDQRFDLAKKIREYE